MCRYQSVVKSCSISAHQHPDCLKPVNGSWGKGCVPVQSALWQPQAGTGWATSTRGPRHADTSCTSFSLRCHMPCPRSAFQSHTMRFPRPTKVLAKQAVETTGSHCEHRCVQHQLTFEGLIATDHRSCWCSSDQGHHQTHGGSHAAQRCPAVRALFQGLPCMTQGVA